MSDEYLPGIFLPKKPYLRQEISPFWKDIMLFGDCETLSQEIPDISLYQMSESDIQMMDVLNEQQEIAMTSGVVMQSEASQVAYDDGTGNTSKDCKESQQRIEDTLYKNQYDSQMNEYTMLYLNKPIEECSYAEVNQAYALNIIETNLKCIEEGLQKQSDSDGIVSETYDFLKYITGLGVDQKDVEAAIESQRVAVSELKEAIKNGTFEQTYQKVTGVKYDPEKIAQYQQTLTELQFAEMQLGITNTFFSSLEEEGVRSNFQGTYDRYVEFYGPEKGEEEFCEALKGCYNMSAFLTPPYVNDLKINDDGEIELVLVNGETRNDGTLAEMQNKGYGDILLALHNETYQNELFKKTWDSIEKSMGLDYEKLIEDYNKISEEVLGEANAVANLLNDYIASQEAFIDNVAGVIQFAGITFIVGGAIACIFPCGKTAGMGMIKAGQFISMTGTFADEYLEAVDTQTNNNLLGEEDIKKYKEIFKEAMIDGALFAAGYAGGAAANAMGNYVLSQTGSKVLQFVADYGSDAALSLLSDMVITGEIDLWGEGASQLLSIITGSTFARMNAKYQVDFEAADVFYKNGDYDGVYKSLTDKGYTQRDIQKYYGEQEVSRLNELYAKTNDLAVVLAEAQKTKLLSSKQFDNLEISLILKDLAVDGVDVAKYNGYDFSCPQGKLIAEDIKIYHEARTTGVDVNDLMIPTKVDFETGKIETSVGGIFETDGKLYLKTDDNSCVELNISKETYCELFPAIDRYSSGQQNSGDCYLVSALNAMMVNPEARGKLLSCFSERIEPDGTKTIIFSMPNSELKIELKEGQNINDLGVKPKKHMTGALGMQLLEYGYKKNLEYNEIQKLNAQIEEVENKLLTAWNEDLELWESFGIEDFDDFKTRLSCPDYYIDKFEEYIGSEPAKDLYDVDALLSINARYTSDGMARISPEGDLTESGAKFLSEFLGITTDQAYGVWNYALKEYHYMNEHTMPQSYFDAKQELNLIENDPQYFEKIAGNGGSSDSVFRAFGISKIQKVDGKFVDEIIANPEKYKDCVITAGTKFTKADYKRDYNDPDHPQYEYWHEHPEAYEEVLKNAPDKLPLEGLVSGHAYSFQITTNSKGETVIEVLNPWSVKNNGDQRSFILTVEEFKSCFNNIYIGELE